MSLEQERPGQHAGPVVSLAETWQVADLLWARQSFTTACGLVAMARGDLMVSRARFSSPGLRAAGREYFDASDPQYVVWAYGEGRRYTLLWYGLELAAGWRSARLVQEAPLEVLRQQWLVKALTARGMPVSEEEVVDGRR